MLSKTNSKGVIIFEKLVCYLGLPDKFRKNISYQISDSYSLKSMRNYRVLTPLGILLKSLGWRF